MRSATIIALLVSMSVHAATTNATTNALSVATNSVRGRLELSATPTSYRYSYKLIPARKDRYDAVSVTIWTVSTSTDTHQRWVTRACDQSSRGSGEYKELRSTSKLLAVHAEMIRDGITLDTRDTLTTNQLKRLDIPNKWWLPGAKVQ